MMLKVNSVLLIIVGSLNLAHAFAFLNHSETFWVVELGLGQFYRTMAVFSVVLFFIYLVAGFLALNFPKKFLKTYLILGLIAIIITMIYFIYSSSVIIFIRSWMAAIGLPVSIFYFTGALQSFKKDKEVSNNAQTPKN